MLGHPAAWTWVHSSLVSASSSHTSHNYALYSVYHFRKFFTLVHIITVVIIMLLYYNMYVDLHMFCCFYFHSICHFHFQKPSVPSSNRVMPASSLPLDASGAQMLWVTCAVMTQNGLLSCIMCERTANTNLPTQNGLLSCIMCERTANTNLSTQNGLLSCIMCERTANTNLSTQNGLLSCIMCECTANA